MNLDEHTDILTFLFTDIEGSTRLWEEQPEQMRQALACHDAILRSAVERNHGVVVKTTGDGVLAAFHDPRDALVTAVEVQRALVDPVSTGGLALRVRCGMNAGMIEGRDGDFFGGAVNRAARIANAAHGGQVLVSQAVADLTSDRLPDGVSLRDLGVVRLRDLSSAERVFQLAHAALREDFPVLRSLEATPNNLAQQVTSFVGRARELVEIKELLGTTRLVTLLGPGGIGKTRLSLQAAADILDDYPDGVWLVELAALTDLRLVPQAVASVLGVKEEAGHPVTDALVKYSKDRRCLLILDNCEHLVQACAEIASVLLQSGPHVRIVASSREPLHAPGETTYHVPPLAVPDTQAATTPEALARYEAVGLFVDRALAAQPSFRVTSQNAAAVAEICSRLDGIPLALELAASRVRALSAEKIAERLTDRFRLLTGGSRTALPRQKTLRALIDWSYDLLSKSEQVLLRRLAVFAGGWTLEAAEAVGSGGTIDESLVLDLQTHLIEKSLVAVVANGERYRLLDTVRHYARELLVESDEENEVRTRHLGFYLALAEKTQPELVGPQQAAWLARLDLEQENILSAHDWSDRAEGGADLGLRLAHALRQYWVSRGLLSLGYRVTVEALTRAAARERNSSRCLALVTAGQLGAFLGKHLEAQGFGEESLSIAREIGDNGQVWSALQVLGIACNQQGDRATAIKHFKEALALARELEPTYRLAAALHNLATLYSREGDPATAEPLYEEALTVAREHGERSNNTVATLRALASVSIGRGLGDRARGMLIDALEIAGKIGSKFAGCQVISGSADLAVFLGDWERAGRLHGAAEAQRQQMGLHNKQGDAAPLEPWIDRARQSLGAATFAVAETGGRALCYEDAMAEVRTWLEKPL